MDVIQLFKNRYPNRKILNTSTDCDSNDYLKKVYHLTITQFLAILQVFLNITKKKII